jgi:hypothetical protein
MLRDLADLKTALAPADLGYTETFLAIFNSKKDNEIN